MRRVLSRVLFACAVVVAQGCPKPTTPPDENSSSSSSSSSSGGVDSSSAQGLSSGPASGSGSSGTVGSSSAATSGALSGSSNGGVSSSAETCTDDCADGTQVCEGADGFRVCGNFDADACLELSPRIGCPNGYACTNGQCLLPCTDECPAQSTACLDANTVVTCGNFDADSCRELGSPSACGMGNHCEAGACVPDSATCSDECTTGSSVCFGNSVRTCGQFDADSCLDLSASTACASTETCVSGACVTTCTDECPATGALQCNGAGFRGCGNFDTDSCLEWGTVTACGNGTFCDQGACVASCTDECTTTGAVQCSADGSSTQTCGQFDADTCLDLSSPVPCGAGSACSNNACHPTCTDECTNGATPRCTLDGTGVETCGNHDADVCLEWGGAVACGGSAVCVNNACNTPCTDECATGARECSGTGFRTCGQFDADSCLDWSTVTACAAYETCAAPGSTCVLGPTPNVILVNELLFDPTGTDTAMGNSLFVELYGPAGAPLDGYEVVGINGSGGAAYNNISLAGQTLGSDGFFLIAHPSGAAALIAQADMTTASVDFQNGPDSVQVRWHGRVVDAVGYGTFSAADVFGGEGTSVAIPAGSSGKSVSRNATHGDTGNNTADFTLQASPSPRGNPVACTDECTMGTTQCSGSQVQACGNFDADSCVEWGTATNCPNFGEACSGNACVQMCVDECATVGATQCAGSQIQTCVTNADADPCREWSAAANCATAGDVCNGGTCAPACADECATLGATRCVGAQVQTCVTNADADPCREWTTATTCPNAGETCSGGSCSIPCTDECAVMGATSCVGTQVRTCGQFDADNCLDWGTPAMCMAGNTCTMGSCQAANAPEVVLITPQGTLQTTQGNTVRMLVDATAAPGRTITAVRYFANGVQLFETTAAPHSYNFVVPATAVTGSTITLQARAVDNLSVVGTSASAYLQVRNDLPAATFAASISGAGIITVDASAVADTETAQGALQVCWDWDNNNSCDTPFSTTKVTTHDYGVGATTVTVRMVVKDAQGQTSETTRSLTFQDIQYIGGTTLNTTTWYGTIVVTGPIVVGAGQTLTISAGTQVLFVRADTNNNGVGDYLITVNGVLVVNGTAAQPVVFTGQDAAAKVPGGWDKLLINGTGSSITYAVIEYADTGLNISGAGTTLNNVTIRSIRGDCLALHSAHNTTLTDVSVSHCAATGVWVNASNPVIATRLNTTFNGQGVFVDTNSLVSWDAGATADNTYNGVVNLDSTVNIQNVTAERNGHVGLLYRGNARGTVTHNQLRQNGREGLLVQTAGTGDPSPVVTLNNIYSNATVGSRRLISQTIPTITASVGYNNTVTSTAYTAPAGSFIRAVTVNYSELDNTGNWVRGFVLNGADNSVLVQLDSSFSGEVYLPDDITSIKVRATDLGYSGTDTISATSVLMQAYDGTSDVVGDVHGPTVNLTKNYLGTWPNVLSRVALNRPSSLNIEGFVGAPMDATWSTGPYKGGNEASGTWSGTLYITGNVTIPAGNTVNVAPGTNVLFVRVDQDNNGEGDYSIHANGAFNLQGTAASGVRVAAYGPAAAKAWQSVNLNGTAAPNTSTWTYVTAESGNRAVVVRGPSNLSQLNVTLAGWDGVMLDGATGATLTDINVQGAGTSGIYLHNADNCTLDRLTLEGSVLYNGLALDLGSTGNTVGHLMARNNAGWGVYVAQGSSLTLTDSTVRENGGGIVIQDSSPTIQYSLITYNRGAAFWIEGASNPAVDHNIIKFNDNSGVVIRAAIGGEPVPTVQYNNIYGNAVAGSSSSVTAAMSLTASVGYNNTVTSGAYTAPAGQSVHRVYISYSELDNTGNWVRGQILDGANNVLRQLDTSFTGWVALPDGVSSIKVRAVDLGYSGTDTITASNVELAVYSTTDHYELTCATSTGTSLAKFNYWTATVGNVPNLIQQWRANSVDFSGYTGLEYPSTGANAVGPRP